MKDIFDEYGNKIGQIDEDSLGNNAGCELLFWPFAFWANIIRESVKEFGLLGFIALIALGIAIAAIINLAI